MGILKKLTKIVLINFAVLVVLILALVLLFVAINWHDQQPSPEAIEFQQFYDGRASVNTEDNGYLYLMGFDVSETESPMEWGTNRVKWTHDVVNTLVPGESTNLPGPSIDIAELRSPELITLAKTCAQPVQACIQGLEGNLPQVTEWLHKEAWFIDRYAQLITFDDWLEIAKVDLLMPLPNYGSVINAQRVYLISLWDQVKTSETPEEIGRALDQDLRFWRLVLKKSDVLITKLIAIVAINNNFYWQNHIARRLPGEEVSAVYSELLKEPISQEELSMYRALVGEWIFTGTGLNEDALDSQNIFYSRFSLQPQDSKNRHAAMLKDLHNSVSVDLSLLPSALNDINNLPSDNKFFWRIENIYNFIGKFLLSQNIPSMYTGYVARVADLEGARRALLLMTTIRSELSQGEDIGTFVQNSDIVNPYTQAPFIWDEKNKELVFVGLETGARGRHSFPL